MIYHEAGWLGALTREQAHGAYPNGRRLGSLNGELVEALGPDGKKVWHFYFVEWDNRPRVAVGVSDWKIGVD